MLSPTVVPRILRLVPLLVAVVLVAKTGPSVAEPGPGDPPAVPTKARERSQAQSYLYRAWTPANGLSQSSIRRLAESSDGYLWLASRAGLVRFDGLKFTAFGVAELPLLSTNESRVVAGAREGGVWVGAAGGVLFRTDGQRALEVLSPREGVIDDRRLAFARNGDLWTANGAGIDRLSGGRWTRFGGAAGIRDGAWTVDIDAAGTVWAGTSRGLFVLKGHSFEAAWTESQSRDFGTEVQSLLGDRRGNLWVGGGTGLSVRRPDGVFERPPGASSIGGPVIALSEGPDATVWGVTPRAVCAWRHEAAPDGPAWAATCYDVRLEGTSPTDLLVTREGVVVVATNTDGLRMLVPRPFRMITAADGLPETPVHHLAEDSDGAL